MSIEGMIKMVETFGYDHRSGIDLPNEKVPQTPKTWMPYILKHEGRWIVLYSKYDFGCALERNTSAYCIGYDNASALRIATAAVLYNVRP